MCIVSKPVTIYFSKLIEVDIFMPVEAVTCVCLHMCPCVLPAR